MNTTPTINRFQVEISETPGREYPIKIDILFTVDSIVDSTIDDDIIGVHINKPITYCETRVCTVSTIPQTLSNFFSVSAPIILKKWYGVKS